MVHLKDCLPCNLSSCNSKLCHPAQGTTSYHRSFYNPEVTLLFQQLCCVMMPDLLYSCGTAQLYISSNNAGAPTSSVCSTGKQCGLVCANAVHTQWCSDSSCRHTLPSACSTGRPAVVTNAKRSSSYDCAAEANPQPVIRCMHLVLCCM